jgi:DNA topoisomerase-1
MQVKEQMLELDPKLKKTRPELAEEESDVDEAFIERHLKALEEKEEQRRIKQLEKENEKRKEMGEKLLQELPDKPGKPPKLSMERLEKKYETLTERIKTQKLALVDKDENKQTALGTSKINYIDPRISAAWCKKYDVPLEKIFNKTLRDKFKWAMEVDQDFVSLS